MVTLVSSSLRELFVLCAGKPLPASSIINYLKDSTFDLTGIDLRGFAAAALGCLVAEGFLKPSWFQGTQYFEIAR